MGCLKLSYYPTNFEVTKNYFKKELTKNFSKNNARKRYEISNPVNGNVHVVVSDRKLLVDANSNNIFDAGDYFTADVLATYDYYAGVGMVMPGRSFDNGYRYGAQGSEVDQEIQSDRNHITTYFREGNLETQQWWSLDPKPSAGVSPYAMFNRNPVLYNDVFGDSIKTNQEGFEHINTGLNATLGDKNPFNFDSKNGVLTFNQEVVKSNTYNEAQKEIIDRFSYLTTSKVDMVNVFVVDYDESINDKGQSLQSLNAYGATMNFKATTSGKLGDDYLKTSQDVFLSRKAMNKTDQKDMFGGAIYQPALGFYKGLTPLHEIGGHAYYNQVGGIKISKSLENQMTEMFENMARQIYMYKGKPVGNKALPHEE